MSISINSGGNGRGRRGSSMGTLSEINVTPFVDIMLVLLIIFMLTAHVMEYGMQVDAPHTKFAKETAQDLPVVTIVKTGTVYLNEKETNLNELKTEIPRRFGAGKAVFVKADKDTIWDVIAQVTAELSDAGFQINMVVQPEDSAAKGRK
jgi:biopolymer transport protein ExbD